MGEHPGHGFNKINAAYGLGGPKLVVQTVEANTGLTINDFVQVNFLGFVKVIDALGGVNICLPFAVDDPYSGLHLSQGLHHVSGITALEYARDRHSFATSDLARIQDQQHLLSSMLTEAISSGTLANPVKLDRFLHAALAAIKVDQGLNVAALADQMRGVSPSDVRFMTVPLSNYNYQTPTGELAVLWNARESLALFNELKHDQPATKPTARHARPSSPKLRRSQVPLQVWNGTLIGGLSASTGTDLSQLGFPVKSGLTWPVHDISQTVIQYPPGDVAGARLVRKAMPGATVQQVKGLAKVRVLLGASGYSVTTGTGTPNPTATSTGVPSATAAQDACRCRPLAGGRRVPGGRALRRRTPADEPSGGVLSDGEPSGGVLSDAEPPGGVLPSGSPSPWDASCRDSASTRRSILPLLSGVPRPVRSAYTVAPRSRNIASARRLAWAWSSLTLPSRAVSCAIWASCVLCALTLSISPMTASAKSPQVDALHRAGYAGARGPPAVTKDGLRLLLRRVVERS